MCSTLALWRSELLPIVFLSLLQLLLSTVPAQVMVVVKDSQGLKKEPQQGLKTVDIYSMSAWICSRPPHCAGHRARLSHTCSLSEAVHLVVSDPAVDGKVVDVSLGGFHFHLGREPGVFRKQREALFVELYQNQLSDGGGAAHSETRHLE